MSDTTDIDPDPDIKFVIIPGEKSNSEGGDAWSCGQGRSGETLGSQVRVPADGEELLYRGFPANKSGHVGYAAMTALCVMR